jgi:glycosyltransferase involved in cell wall biosynthesis
LVKVLNIISDANIGGAGRVLLNYIRHSDRTAFETIVCLPQGSLLSPALKELGTEVVEAPITPDKSFSPGDVRALHRVIKEIKPDLVHTHGSLSGRIAGRLARVPVIYTRHSVFPVSPRLKKGPGRAVNKWLNESLADGIIAVSPAAKANLVEMGISPERIDIVMNGVEAIPRKSPEECAAFRNKHGIRPDDFVLGILARIEPYKGHADILQALKILRDEGRAVKLLIAGAGTCEEEIRQLTASLGLESDVVFLGFVQDVASVLSVLDVQLNASWGTEATSLSLLEGMSIGLPALVSNYGGNPYLIHDGINGLVFPARDVSALAAAVRRCMDDREMLEKLGRGAFEDWSARLTAKIFAENTENVYRHVLKGAIR